MTTDRFSSDFGNLCRIFTMLTCFAAANSPTPEFHIGDGGRSYCVTFSAMTTWDCPSPGCHGGIRAAAGSQAGAGASPLIADAACFMNNWSRSLRAFEQAEACIVFPSGYAANVGTLCSLAGPRMRSFANVTIMPA